MIAFERVCAVWSACLKQISMPKLMMRLCDGRVRLDEQLGALESRLGEADSHVQHLLGHSTALWLAEGSQCKGRDSKGGAEETQQIHDGSIGEDAGKHEAAGADLKQPTSQVC